MRLETRSANVGVDTRAGCGAVAARARQRVRRSPRFARRRPFGRASAPLGVRIEALDLDLDGDIRARERLAPRALDLLELRLADRTQPREDLSLDLREGGFVDLAQLEPHLRIEELLAERLLAVAKLGLGRGDDRVEHESHAVREQAVEKDHRSSSTRSSLRRMLTKLYGGHGPV